MTAVPFFAMRGGGSGGRLQGNVFIASVLLDRWIRNIIQFSAFKF